jgi:hypothetical protein
MDGSVRNLWRARELPSWSPHTITTSAQVTHHEGSRDPARGITRRAGFRALAVRIFVGTEAHIVTDGHVVAGCTYVRRPKR